MAKSEDAVFERVKKAIGGCGRPVVCYLADKDKRKYHIFYRKVHLNKFCEMTATLIVDLAERKGTSTDNIINRIQEYVDKNAEQYLRENNGDH